MVDLHVGLVATYPNATCKHVAKLNRVNDMALEGIAVARIPGVNGDAFGTYDEQQGLAYHGAAATGGLHSQRHTLLAERDLDVAKIPDRDQ
jgi:hypothetical protein